MGGGHGLRGFGLGGCGHGGQGHSSFWEPLARVFSPPGFGVANLGLRPRLG
jgi:hypothetical protein